MRNLRNFLLYILFGFTPLSYGQGLADTIGQLNIGKGGEKNKTSDVFDTSKTFETKNQLWNPSALIDSNFFNPLEEVVVSAYRTAESKRNITQEITVIRSKDIQNSMQGTTVDVLSNQNSIAVQKSQQGGGSIILRGMEANRVLLVIDGIRMNNLIYRSGHLQNAITVDPHVLDRIEVSFGPTSNAYGSDALGGVVHFITETPSFTERKQYSWHEKVQYSSANNSWINNVKFRFSNKNFASLTSFTSSVYDDLKSGKRINPFYGESHGDRNYYVRVGLSGDTVMSNKNPHLQLGSGYSQIDLLQKIVFRSKKNRTSTINIQFSNSSDIPRYDRLTDLNPATNPGQGPNQRRLKFSSWYYGPQKRFLTSYQWRARKIFGFDGVNVSVYHQNIEESRITRKFGSEILKSRVEQVYVSGFNSDAIKRWGNNTLRAGFDGSYQQVFSTATGENIFNSNAPVLPISTRYPGGQNVMSSLAVFATHVNKISNQFKISEGFRVGLTSLFSQFSDITYVPLSSFGLRNTIYQRSPVASGSIGIIYEKSKFSKHSVSFSTAYRVPNIDDLAKVFDSRPGQLIIPNPNLRPEQAFTAEIGNIQLFKGGHNLEWNVYSTSLRDALVVLPTQLNGADSVIFDGDLSAVLSQSNARNARIMGYSIKSLINLPYYLSLKSQIQGVLGRMRIESQSIMTHLDHIPPVVARVGLQYIPSSDFSADLFLISNSEKSIDSYCLNGEDNAHYATPMGTPKWVTWNFAMSYHAGRKWIFQIGVYNILDTQYRTFASGINAPGRNITASIKNSF
jgi:hemoglobin/transferrin/lactoferrin receptor protein